jgi:NAD(P)-dependent dehydrogenase (short-subunit alcohol dehydrogenase family)
MRPQRMSGLVAIVTGGGQGIGRAIAARFLEEGARVVIFDIDRHAADDAVAEYTPGESVAVPDAVRAQALRAEIGSAADEADIQRAIDATVRWAGRLDVLVNNAAIANPDNGPLERLALADWQRLIDTNLTGPMLCAKHAIGHLRAQRGTIINITSTRAYMSEPNTEGYSAAKAGLVGLTHALASSLGPAIRVNAIAPGWIATDAWKPRAQRKQPELRDVDHAQHPVGRVGRPEDVAALCAYLASNEATFVTGQVFTIDGGMTRKMIYAE